MQGQVGNNAQGTRKAQPPHGLQKVGAGEQPSENGKDKYRETGLAQQRP